MMGAKGKNSILLPTVFIFLCMSSSHAEPETNSLRLGHQLKDGEHDEHLLSAGKVFTLKFFSPISRKVSGFHSPDLLRDRYLGIFYQDSDYKRPVWVANRNNPFRDRSGSLVIDNNGTLKILHAENTLLVLSSPQESAGTSIVLMDSGNLVFSDSSGVLWQSFDYPTDTLLPGMRLGLRNGISWNLTSWVSDTVPATGSFTLGIDPNGTSQFIIWRRGQVYWKSGIWSHENDGMFEHFQDYTYRFSYTSNEFERSFVLSFVHDWRITSPLFMISELGILRKSNPEFSVNSSFHMTNLIDCHKQIESGVGFSGQSKRFVSPGCVSFEFPECHSRVSIWRMPGYAVNVGLHYMSDDSWSIADCEALCLSNCSCVAFASWHHNGTACQFWTNRSQITLDSDGYTVFYVLLTHPPDYNDLSIHESLRLRIITGVVISLLVLSLAFISCSKRRYLRAYIVLKKLCKLLHWKVRATGKHRSEEETSFVELGTTSSQASRFRREKHLKILYYKSHGLQLFSFEVLFQATNGFSPSNKLGQGGFGTVYKGKLEGGQELALKRLSKSSRQGLTEFKNELSVLAKLQHTNLVKIIGCCVERGVKIIVYEYMPNKSLDSFLLDPERKMYLDWKKRFHIIEGIAQGLIYLHKYSRLKIIHRDLKPANILLDEDLGAKISDFGMARIFEQDESQANTNRIAGTHGYMPPEYTMAGNYSEKTDVFSFGVLLVEIVCGKKNNASYRKDCTMNLIGHAWELWTENRGCELIDETLEYSLYDKRQAMRCIHVGLLCTQEQPAERPSMSDVVAMISNESIQLGPPNRPAFFFGRNSSMEIDLSCDDSEKRSFNDVSISDMVVR